MSMAGGVLKVMELVISSSARQGFPFGRKESGKFFVPCFCKTHRMLIRFPFQLFLSCFRYLAVHIHRIAIVFGAWKGKLEWKISESGEKSWDSKGGFLNRKRPRKLESPKVIEQRVVYDVGTHGTARKRRKVEVVQELEKKEWCGNGGVGVEGAVHGGVQRPNQSQVVGQVSIKSCHICMQRCWRKWNGFGRWESD